MANRALLNSDKQPQLLYSLKGHSLPITCLAFLRLWLFSSDASGMVYCWSLRLRRPHCLWQAHEASILLLNFDEKTQVLVTHARDSRICFWDLRDAAATATPPMRELPVNSLNFCNIAIDAPVLLVPSTLNSDHFDLYELHLVFAAPQLSFSRLAHDVDPWQLYLAAIKRLPVPLDDDLSKRDKFGIMMRTIWINHNTFYIGYESGHVLGFHIDYSAARITTTATATSTTTSLVNASPAIRLFHISATMCPNPILSLCYCDGQLLVGSASKMLHTLSVPDAATLTEAPLKTDIVLLKYSGISDIARLANTICIAFWNGMVGGFDRQLTPVFQIAKPLPAIDTTDEATALRLKVKTIATRSPAESCGTDQQLPRNAIRSKRDVSASHFLAIAYENGSINVYKTHLD